MRYKAQTRGIHLQLFMLARERIFLFIVLFMINLHCNDKVIMITTWQMKMFEV